MPCSCKVGSSNSQREGTSSATFSLGLSVTRPTQKDKCRVDLPSFGGTSLASVGHPGAVGELERAQTKPLVSHF